MTREADQIAPEIYRCAAGRGCRTRSGGVPIGTSRGLCEKCCRNVAGAILGLGEDLIMLGAAVTDRETSAAEHVSGTPEPQIPLNTAAIGLRSTLSDWCQAALVLVAESLNIEPAGRHKSRGYPVRDSPAILQAARVLPTNMAKLLDAPKQPVNVWVQGGIRRQVLHIDGVEVALRITQVHWQVRNMLGEPSPRRRLSMPCPVQDCGAMTLGINEDDNDVTCTSCGGRWSQRLYDWLATFLISEQQRSTEEKTVLEWLLAEKTWQEQVATWLLAEKTWQEQVATWLLAQANWRLDNARRITRIPHSELSQFDAVAVATLLEEVLK